MNNGDMGDGNRAAGPWGGPVGGRGCGHGRVWGPAAGSRSRSYGLGRQPLPEVVALPLELEYVAAMSEAVQQRGDQASIVVEYAGPLSELQVGSEAQPASGVPVGQQDEEELGLVGIEAEEPELIAYQEVESVQLGLQPTQSVLRLSLGALHHQFSHGDEPHPTPLTAAGKPDGAGDVGLAGAGRPR